MPQLRKPLYQRNDGADEDRWRLVLDTDAGRLFVEHEQKRGDMRGRGYGLHTDELNIDAVLRDHGPVRDELVRLLGALFAERTDARAA